MSNIQSVGRTSKKNAAAAALVGVLLLCNVGLADGIHYYGKWGGPGHGGDRPIDTLDRAYRRHDSRYAKSVWWRASRADAQVIEESMIASLNPFNDTRLHGRVLGPISAGVFAVKPSFYETRVFGQTLPIPSVGVTSVGLHQVELGVKGTKRLLKKIF